MNILITGGTGYLGSHAAIAFAQSGHEIFLYDDFSNSSELVLKKIEKILRKKIKLVQGDIRNTAKLSSFMKEVKVSAVIHFAGHKSVSESVSDPIKYYDNNVYGTLSLLRAMNENNIKSIVFSSSATVYGLPTYLPYDENHSTIPINPYGMTKLHIEQILKDISTKDVDFKVVCLRYFNPVGAHTSGLLGENPNGAPNNLMPFITGAAVGRFSCVNIYGSDYPTKDGTGERDYIHVMDLAESHVFALGYLSNNSGYNIFNIGSGKPYSVLEVINAYERVNSIKVNYKYMPRRLGDLPIYYSDSKKANSILGWSSYRSLDEICQTAHLFAINEFLA